MKRSPQLVVVDETSYERPRTRGDCEAGGPLHIRPCPFVCPYRLRVELRVQRDGSLECGGLLLSRDASPEEVEAFTEEVATRMVTARGESCVLDVAARGEMTLEEVGRTFALTRERIRQIEHRAMPRLRWLARSRGIVIR